jgi:hypothetical protein
LIFNLISTKNRKLQVFVSSTFTDLREERQAAVEAILGTGNIPAGMELFAAGDQSQMEVIKEWIRESDVYLLIHQSCLHLYCMVSSLSNNNSIGETPITSIISQNIPSSG